jgi:hypothetical protein
MFRTLQQDFEAGLRLSGQAVGSLEELTDGAPCVTPNCQVARRCRHSVKRFVLRF